AAGAQLPAAFAGRAGRIGGAVQRAERPVHGDVVGAAVAASRDQLVADVVELVGVAVLVALGGFRDQAHARILVAHAAGGDVGAGLALVGELVRAEELVATTERHVALEHGLFLGPAQGVAVDVGRLVDARAGDAGRVLRIRECRDGIHDRAQAPVFWPF